MTEQLCLRCKGATPPTGKFCGLCGNGKTIAEQIAAKRHECHAKGCIVKVAPAKFMCPAHWRALTQQHRDRIWATYRRGQEIRKDPTDEYMEAAMERDSVSGGEGRTRVDAIRR